MYENKALTKEPLVSMVNEVEETRQSMTINFTELYRKNAAPVFYYLYSRVRSVADAEDLTSQTFMIALENLSRLRDPRKFTSWVFTIARNKAFDYFRQSRRRPTVDYNEDLDAATAMRVGLSPTDQDCLFDLERLMSQLSPLDQEYLSLRIVAELPFAEIAVILGEPETRVKKKYYRLLERLRAQVEK